MEICGKLTWTRNDCYNGITSPRVINENNVAVKQRQAAMAVWNRCNVDKKGLDHTCLANDFKKKLTDKVEDEVKRLGQCAHSGVEDMGACLGINGLDQTRLYAMMEDSLFVYRSMYVEHINRRAVSTVVVSAVVESMVIVSTARVSRSMSMDVGHTNRWLKVPPPMSCTGGSRSTRPRASWSSRRSTSRRPRT